MTESAEGASGSMMPELRYQSGFGNHFQSEDERCPGALPQDQNNPRIPPYGLYAEQLSGTAFTAPRSAAQRSWLYRVKPCVTHQPFRPAATPPAGLMADFTDASDAVITPNQLRWRPAPIPAADHPPTDFVQGLSTVCGAGSAATKDGFAVHTYAATTNMNGCLANCDGDLLIVPQMGEGLHIKTEFGRMIVAVGEICVIPRGVRFAVDLQPDAAGGVPAARGYVLETFTGHFTLPNLGPIGANGLADPRHFLTPVAWYEDVAGSYVVQHKFLGRLFEAEQAFSPFNVVAWHGNYAPFKYDLQKFCPMGSVQFDHPDPSIYTVLTVPSGTAGIPVLDFVIFPPRWSVAENTFRPPYYHRNCMTEFMGLIRGVYDGKSDGFQPGGASLHMCMTPHGPDMPTFEAASKPASETPAHLPDDTLAFMFESMYTPRVSRAALESPLLDREYHLVWSSLRKYFNPEKRVMHQLEETAEPPEV